MLISIKLPKSKRAKPKYLWRRWFVAFAFLKLEEDEDEVHRLVVCRILYTRKSMRKSKRLWTRKPDDFPVFRP